jgi:hypothetical protein
MFDALAVFEPVVDLAELPLGDPVGDDGGEVLTAAVPFAPF